MITALNSNAQAAISLRLRGARIDLDGVFHDAHTLIEVPPDEFLSFPWMHARGNELALVWQTGQNRAMGVTMCVTGPARCNAARR
jgi:hypothetical protein